MLFVIILIHLLILWNWSLYIPISPSPQPLAKSIVFSIPKSLTSILDFSCKWPHILFVLLCLAYFTLNNAFQIYPCCCKQQSFLVSQGWKIFLYVYVPLFLYPSSFDGHLGYYHALTTMNNAAIDVGVQSWSLFKILISIPLLMLIYILRSRIAGSSDSSIFNSLRNQRQQMLVRAWRKRNPHTLLVKM